MDLFTLFSSANMIITEIISGVKMYSPTRHGDALKRQRQGHLCNFETNLVYVVNSRKVSHFVERLCLKRYVFPCNKVRVREIRQDKE